MKKFKKIIDETGQNMKLKGIYHGKHKLKLEAKIMKCEEDFLIGIFLDNEEIESSNYDTSRHSLDIWYKKNPIQPGEVRYGTLPTFQVNKNIKEINVYDIGQKP